MTRLTLCRFSHAPAVESDLERIRHVLFGWIDGLGRDDKKGWRKFWKTVLNLEPGEVIEFETRFPRNSKHHRLFFATISAVYDAQERFQDFDMFRHWLLIGAGHVEWAAGAKGGVVPLAKSISYAAADEHEFSTIHAKVLDFLRGDHCAPFLWPKMDPQAAADMMETILEGFEREQPA
jgi:Protein of unknown function (DUF1367)